MGKLLSNLKTLLIILALVGTFVVSILGGALGSAFGFGFLSSSLLAIQLPAEKVVTTGFEIPVIGKWYLMNTMITTWLAILVLVLLAFVIRSGILKAMFLAGLLMASTNLLFSLLAWSERSELLFVIAVVFDDIAAAFATVAFVAFISLLVDRTYTATQYALLASLGTAGRTTLASSSGALVDWLNGDWGIFFILTALMVIPSLIILWILKSKIKIYEK